MKQILEIKYEVNWLKVCFLSLPFGMIYFINLEKSSLWFNVVILAGFGLYYLLAIWLTIKKRDKGIN
jgi:ABC-type transport system involved in multi-copper enzyme maturation permease subunit